MTGDGDGEAVALWVVTEGAADLVAAAWPADPRLPAVPEPAERFPRTTTATAAPVASAAMPAMTADAMTTAP